MACMLRFRVVNIPKVAVVSGSGSGIGSGSRCEAFVNDDTHGKRTNL
jgi:hypothetical protein